MPAVSSSSSRRREKERTGIPNLRVAYNSVHGYYIEVTNSHVAKVPGRLPPPADAEERRALHHAGAEDLRGQGAVGARPRARAGEVAVRAAAGEAAAASRRAADASRARWRRSTCCAAFAGTAAKPKLLPTRSSPSRSRSRSTAGRHPVVEAQIESFIANDCRLSPARRMLLITGPNMGGKSTYMRQVALIVLMAHVGSLRAGARRAPRPDRPDLHAHRRRRRPRRRALDLHGGDDRERRDPAQRHRRRAWC